MFSKLNKLNFKVTSCIFLMAILFSLNFSQATALQNAKQSPVVQQIIQRIGESQGDNPNLRKVYNKLNQSNIVWDSSDNSSWGWVYIGVDKIHVHPKYGSVRNLAGTLIHEALHLIYGNRGEVRTEKVTQNLLPLVEGLK